MNICHAMIFLNFIILNRFRRLENLIDRNFTLSCNGLYKFDFRSLQKIVERDYASNDTSRHI